MSEPSILTTDPDAVDVPVDDLEVISLTRGEWRAREESIKNATWKAARLQFGRPRATEALAARLASLESFVSLLADRMLNRIEASGASPHPAAQDKEH